MNDHLTEEELHALAESSSGDEPAPHLATCERCRRELDGLRVLIAELGGLPRCEDPPRDLWPEVEARLRGAGVVPRGGRRTPSDGPAPTVGWPLLSAAPAAVDPGQTSALARAPRGTHRAERARRVATAAAAAGVVVLLVAGARLVGLPGSTEPTAPRAVARSAQRPTIAFAAFGPSEADFEAAAGDLLGAFEARKATLRPETVRVIEENLRVIDGAIANIRAALAADPASRDLTFLLASTYEMKLDLLRRGAQLPRAL